MRNNHKMHEFKKKDSIELKSLKIQLFILFKSNYIFHKNNTYKLQDLNSNNNKFQHEWFSVFLVGGSTTD